MKKTFKKRGQKLKRQLSKISKKAGEEGLEHIQENFIDRISHAKNVRLLILEWSLLVAVLTFLAITQAFWYKNSYATITFTNGGTYSEATLGKVNSLNPLFATTSSEKTLSRLMFSSLATTDYSGHTGLGLASSIKVDDSGKIWTLKLRDNLRWSDGEPITNADVLYTVKVIQDPTVRTSYSSNLTGVKLSEEDGNLIFTLSSPYANFSSSLDFPILPAHILSEVAASNLLEHSFSTKPVTSGAFAHNATQSVGTEGEKIIYLAKNPHYYNGAPLLDNFTIHAYPSLDGIKTAISSGTVTATAELSEKDAPDLKGTNLIQRQTSLNSGIYAFLNISSSTLSNLTLRQALRQGIDINKLLLTLDGEQRLDYPLISNQIDISNYPTLPDYDPEAAKETIASLNLPEDFELNLATVSTGDLPELAESLAGELRELGIPTSVQVFEPNQDFLVGIVRPRAYDILLYEIELGPDPDLFAYYHSSQASETGLNLSNYKSALADDLILGARNTMDHKLRVTKYETFLKHWVDDVPAIGIAQMNLTYYVNKDVRTFSEDSRLVDATDRFADITRWGTETTTKNRTP